MSNADAHVAMHAATPTSSTTSRLVGRMATTDTPQLNPQPAVGQTHAVGRTYTAAADVSMPLFAHMGDRRMSHSNFLMFR